ncbi:MAG: hypothetical protein GY946_20365 [bacterium]|nr:hypothetical protein [bacterium]
MSLPHWGNAYGVQPNENGYLYPYGGEGDYGGGHGERWNYYQDVQEFVSPICEIPEHQYFGTERSDAMQRDRKCWEWRGTEEGPWDGFSDFSALAIYRFVNGAHELQSGEIPYRGGSTPYQLMTRNGFPSLEFNDQGDRVLRRYDGFESQNFEERIYAVPQQWEVPVHTVYASYNAATPAANIVYAPMSYTGNLPAVIDPTDSDTFTELQSDNGIYDGYFNSPHDLIFRFVYTEGEDLHAVYPHSGTNCTPNPGMGPWRGDIMYMALTIPGDRSLSRIEMYNRPFAVRGENDDTEGNIRNQSFGITAANFMDSATLLASIDL